jgi:GTP-binding protein YchF
MKLGIIGKPQSGKTTVFNAASGQHEAVGDYSRAVHRAIIKVPDQRLEKVAEIVEPRKVTPAEIEFLDAAGFTGEGKEAKDLEITQDLRQMEAFILVVDAFSPNAESEKDIQSIIDEMILLDQAMVESNVTKRERKAQLTGDKSDQQEIDLLKRCLESLEHEQLLIDLEFSETDAKILRGYQLLTMKPLLIVINIPEEALGQSGEIFNRYRDFIQAGKRDLVVVCGKIEMELIGLDDEDRRLFMEDLGIETSATEQLIQRAYRLLGLISFFTATEPEARAWPIPRGTVAHKAAGVVHSDMERGFIRAEVVSYEDFVKYRSSAALKAEGKLRLEGKEYVVADGDVIQFRFNV